MCNALILSLSKFWKVIAQRLIILAISFRPQIPHHKELSQKGKYWQHPTLSEITPTQSALIGISRSGGSRSWRVGQLLLGWEEWAFHVKDLQKRRIKVCFTSTDVKVALDILFEMFWRWPPPATMCGSSVRCSLHKVLHFLKINLFSPQDVKFVSSFGDICRYYPKFESEAESRNKMPPSWYSWLKPWVGIIAYFRQDFLVFVRTKVCETVIPCSSKKYHLKMCKVPHGVAPVFWS